MHGAPPKVVWLRLGNSSTNAVAALLRSSKAVLAEFVADPTKALLMLANRTAS